MSHTIHTRITETEDQELRHYAQLLTEREPPKWTPSAILSFCAEHFQETPTTMSTLKEVYKNRKPEDFSKTVSVYVTKEQLHRIRRLTERLRKEVGEKVSQQEVITACYHLCKPALHPDAVLN